MFSCRFKSAIPKKTSIVFRRNQSWLIVGISHRISDPTIIFNISKKITVRLNLFNTTGVFFFFFFFFFFGSGENGEIAVFSRYPTLRPKIGLLHQDYSIKQLMYYNSFCETNFWSHLLFFTLSNYPQNLENTSYLELCMKFDCSTFFFNFGTIMVRKFCTHMHAHTNI